MAKNFLDLPGLSDFLSKLRETFSALKHTHTKSEITDLIIDPSLSSTSRNPVENKAVKTELDTKVPTSRTVNGKSLSSDITLSASDVGADASGSASTVQSNLNSHTDNTDVHITSDERDNWNTAVEHISDEDVHIPSGGGEGQILNWKSEGVAEWGENEGKPLYVNVTVDDSGSFSIDSTYDEIIANINNGREVYLTNISNSDSLYLPFLGIANSVVHFGGLSVGELQYIVCVNQDNSVIDSSYTITAESINLGNVENKNSATIRSEITKTNVTDALGYTPAQESDITTAINTHNTSTSAHSDIRTLVSELSTQLNNFLDVDDTTKDQLSEVISLIENNQDLIEGITTSKVNVSDIIDNLTTNVSNKPLSAAQGVVIKGLIDALQSELDTHENNSDIHFTTTERTKLSGIATGAEVNQNAFSNIVVGSTTIAADSKTDSLTLAGSNVTISADATNDKVTFSVANGTTSAKGVVQLTNSTSSTSTTTAATPNSVKSAYDLANTAKTNAATAQTAAETAQETADSKVGSVALASGTNNGTLKLTVDGTTTDNIAVKGLGSAAYTESSAYATLGHTHNYAGSSSVGGAATSANKLNTNAGSATQPVYFADGVPKPTTYALNKTVPSDAVFTDTVYTHPSYTARTGVPTANQTPAFGGTFTVSQPVSDATGHITAVNSRTITIPNAVATTSAVGLMSTSDKTKLNGIATGAEVNQNAFSNVSVNGTTVAADAKTDTLTLAGSNVTLTPDATNDKVTIGITKDNVVSALGYEPGQTNAIVIENVTIPVSGFVAQDDGTYLYTMTSDLVVDDTLVDVYFSKDCQKAGMKAGIMVTSEVGKIHFHATKLPTISLVVETLRIINPSQDDSYNEAYDTELEELQNPTFEDYSSTAYSEEFDISVGKIVSKGLFSKILEGIKGSLINLNTRLTSCNNDLKNIVDKIYPIGSIYTSIQDINPSTLFGGTWEQIKDTFLLAAGSTYSAGATGGEATHKLTTAEMPSHTHTFTGTAASHTHTFTGTAASHSHTSRIFDTNNADYKMEIAGVRLTTAPWQTAGNTTAGSTGGDSCGITSSTSVTPKGTNANTSVTPKGTNSSVGSGTAHNNMPPYLTVYMWKRTA